MTVNNLERQQQDMSPVFVTVNNMATAAAATKATYTCGCECYGNGGSSNKGHLCL